MKKGLVFLLGLVLVFCTTVKMAAFELLTLENVLDMSTIEMRNTTHNGGVGFQVFNSITPTSVSINTQYTIVFRACFFGQIDAQSDMDDYTITINHYNGNTLVGNESLPYAWIPSDYYYVEFTTRGTSIKLSNIYSHTFNPSSGTIYMYKGSISDFMGMQEYSAESKITETTISVDLDNKPTTASLKSSIVATTEGGVVIPTEIYYDDYSTSTLPGSYHLVLSAFHSGVTKYYVINIDVINNNQVLIIGPEIIYVYSTGTPLSESDILARYTAYDSQDNTVSLYISSNSYNESIVAGEYVVIIKSCSFPEETLPLKIIVIENHAPIFDDSNLNIYLTKTQFMNEFEIIEYLVSEKTKIGDNISNVQILYNEYQGNENISGDYLILLSYNNNYHLYETKLAVHVRKNNTSPFLIVGICIVAVGVVTIPTMYVFMKKRKLMKH